MTSGINDTTFVKKLVGSRVKMARERKKYSRPKLVGILNNYDDRPILRNQKDSISVIRLRKWEEGENPVETEWIPFICRALDCGEGYLYGEYDELNITEHEISAYTGLDQESIRTLHLLNTVKHDEERGVTVDGTTLLTVSLLDDIINSPHFHNLFKEIALYLIDSKVVPGQIKKSNVSLTPAEHERFQAWAESSGLVVETKAHVANMHIQNACDFLKAVFRDVLEKAKGDNK